MEPSARALGLLRAWWIDGLLLLAILVGAFFWVHVPPEFAANLPQDAGDFTIPAMTFVERGRMVVPAYGLEFAMGHPVGLPMLLVPVYLFGGHFIGNGIYLVLLFSLALVVLVYVIGRQLGGRIGGVFSALFLVSHHGFQQYSEKIMSEVPSCFLMTALFALALYVAKKERGGGAYLLMGILFGLTLVIRYDNVLVAVPLLALWALGQMRVSRRGIIFLLIGMAPWLLVQVSYNVRYYGHFSRTGYEYEGNTGSAQCPMFGWRHALTRSYMACRNIPLALENRVDGNLSLYGKTLLNEADITLSFSEDPRWAGRPKRAYQGLVVVRAFFGVIGLVLCLWWGKRNEAARRLLVWVTALTLAMMVFYALYFWQEERFLLRLAPFFSLLDGLGVCALVYCFQSSSRWMRLICGSSVLGAAAALIALLLTFSARQLILPSDDNLNLYAVMQTANSLMEKNAVVITNYDPLRIDVHLIRGTDRLAIQLGDDANYTYVPKPGGLPQHMSPLKAVDRPEVIIQYMRQGRPVYLLSKYIVDPHTLPEFQSLSKNLVFEAIGQSQVEGQKPQPVFFRVHATGLPFLIQ